VHHSLELCVFYQVKESTTSFSPNAAKFLFVARREFVFDEVCNRNETESLR
jgi:hypothetical protein